MTTTIVLLARDIVALADGSRDPPNAFRIFRKGANETTKGVFLFDDASAAHVMEGFQRHGADVPIDYEHKMLDWLAPAEDMKAAGWFVPELRDGELWATNVRWTSKAAAALREGEWRYISPAFVTDEEGRITSLINVALTNLPATHQLEALVAASERAVMSAKPPPASPGKENPIMKNVLSALGLSDNATEADAVVALARKSESASQNEKAVQEVLSIVGATTVSEAIGKVAGLRDEAGKTAKLSARVVELETGLRKKEVERIVEEKVALGFLTPATREFAVSLGVKDDESFQAYLKTLTSQPINTSGGKDKPAADGAAKRLSKDERDIAKKFGMAPEVFVKTCLRSNPDELADAGEEA